MGLENFLPVCRKLRNHWIYKDNDYYKVWSEMLFTARYSHELKEGYYNGVKYSVGYGEFIFGRTQWSIDCNIAEGKLRRLIDKLIKENMIEVKSKTNKFTIFKIVNFSIYNDPNFDQQTVQQMTSKQPANRPAESVAITSLDDNVDQQMTSKVTSKPTSKQSTKEDRKKIEKKIEYISLSSDIEKVKLTEKQYTDLVSEYGEVITKRYIEKVELYCSSNGKSYKNYKSAIVNFIKNDIDRGFLNLNNQSSSKGYVRRNSKEIDFD